MRSGYFFYGGTLCLAYCQQAALPLHLEKATRGGKIQIGSKEIPLEKRKKRRKNRCPFPSLYNRT